MGIFNQVFGKKTRSNFRPAGLRKRPVRFEALERREMLTAVTVNLASGDSAVISRDSVNNEIDVTVNGTLEVSTPEAPLDTLTINGTSGNETVTIQDLGTVFDGDVVLNADVSSMAHIMSGHSKKRPSKAFSRTLNVSAYKKSYPFCIPTEHLVLNCLSGTIWPESTYIIPKMLTARCVFPGWIKNRKETGPAGFQPGAVIYTGYWPGGRDRCGILHYS